MADSGEGLPLFFCNVAEKTEACFLQERSRIEKYVLRTGGGNLERRLQINLMGVI